MSWLDQGRQEHGWFGSGTSAGGQESENPLLAPSQGGDRIGYAAGSIIGFVPRSERGRWMSALDGYRADQLKAAFAGWFGAASKSRGDFRALLLEPGTPDEVVDDIRTAARDVVGARTEEQLNGGAAALASAAKAIGPDRWARFVADSGGRAEAAIARSQLPGVTQIAASDTFTGLLGGVVIAGGAMWWLFGGSATKQHSTPVPAPTATELPTIAPATPPRDAKDPNGAKAPGKPGPEQDFKDPKSGKR